MEANFPSSWGLRSCKRA